MHTDLKKMDTKELELPETVFIRDIESKVFESIAIQCLSHIKGVGLLEGNFIDTLLGKEPLERIKGISVEQDLKNHSVTIKIELNVAYGVSIPEKAEEVQTKIAEEISRFTGIHVACVHVVFKNLISPKIEAAEDVKSFFSTFETMTKPDANEYSVEF